MGATSADSTPVTTRALGVGVVLFITALYAFGIFDHSLWTPDEPRVASIARQVAAGSWVVPTLNGEPFLEQPPLFYWCVALYYTVFGFECPYAARIISTVFCCGALVFTYLLGSALAGGDRGRRVGLFSAFSLALSLEFFHTAHRLVVDSALVFFTTASAHACLGGLSATRPGTRLAWFSWASLLASLAFLTKGAIGLAVPLCFLLAAVSASRRPRLLFEPALAAFPIIFLAVTLPWFLELQAALGNRGMEELLLDNTLGRVLPWLAGDRAHVRPFYYYLAIPAHLVPALFFMLGGVIDRFRRRRSLRPKEGLAYDTTLLWFALGIVLLSVASTKRAVYCVPFFPALAIAAGLWLEGYSRGHLQGIYEKVVGYLLAGTLLLFAAALPVSFLLFRTSLVWLMPASALGMLAAVATTYFARKGARAKLLITWSTGVLFVAICAFLSLLPAFDAMKNLGPVSRQMSRLVPADECLYAFRPDETTRAMIPLYTGRALSPLASVDELQALLEEKQQPIYILAVDKTYRKRRRRFEALQPFPRETLLSEDRPSSRSFRLFRLSAPDFSGEVRVR